MVTKVFDYSGDVMFSLKSREKLQNGEHAESFCGCGDNPHVVIATGRATCRLCGEKIKKGEDCMTFTWSPDDNGWTARDVYIHMIDCKSKSHPEIE